MADPESREADEKKRDDDSPEPLTLSNPETVPPVDPDPADADKTPETAASDDDPWSRDRRTEAEDAEILRESSAEEIAAEEPAAPPPPVRKPEPPRRNGPPGFLILLVGGIAGAAGGFAYSRLAQPDWPLATFGQNEQAAALQGTIDALRAELVAKPKAAVVTAPPADLKKAEDRAAAAEARVAELQAKLASAGSVAATPASGSVEAELAALREQIAQTAGVASNDVQTAAAARIAKAEQEAAKLKADVEAAARAATTAAAVAQVRASIDGGVAYAEALEELATKGVAIPVTLIEGGKGDVPTLPELEDAFPEAARSALSVSRRAVMGDDWLSRAKAFLLTEAGIRSLKPREGDDPDAILSRAEAALHEADLPKALAEIATLPAEGQEALADWTAQAQKRIEALDAVAALAAAAEGK